MTRGDVGAVRRVLLRLRANGLSPESVLVFSPAWDSAGAGVSETAAISDVWPEARVVGCDKGRWDLNGPMSADVPQCDLGLICNTFMCSSEPAAWLERISTAVPVLIVQDLAVSHRTEDRHCSVETGDVARYSVSSHGIIGETDPGLTVFDFSACGYGILDAEEYTEGGVKFAVTLQMRHKGVAPCATCPACWASARSSFLG